MLLEHYPRDGTAIKKFCSEALIIFQASIKNIMSAAIYECLGTVPDRREKWVDHRGAGLGMSLALLGIPPRNEVRNTRVRKQEEGRVLRNAKPEC
jgi:hypothetical protein